MKGAYIDRHNIPFAPYTEALPDVETGGLPELTRILTS